MTVGMDNVEQSHNVGITHLLEEGNLADGGGGNALILGLKTNLLERDNSAIVGKVSRLVDNTVGTCIKWNACQQTPRQITKPDKSNIPSPIFSSFW